MSAPPPVVITCRRIRRHNFRCLARMILWGLGAGSVFLVLFLFAWLLASIFRGRGELTVHVAIAATTFASLFFLAGRRHLQRKGPLDWEKIAQAPVRTPGMRISTRRQFDYARAGAGVWSLLLDGSGWLDKISGEWRSMMPPRQEIAGRLESLRRNLAAREGWEPLHDFASHEDDLYRLAKLEMLAIREIRGRWYFHVTLEGSARQSKPKGQAPEKSGADEALEIDG